MLKNQLSQKQLQKLSPQQIQLMKLLQIPTALLEQRIQEELEINPALEEQPNDGNEEAFISEPQRETSQEETNSDKDTDISDIDQTDTEDYESYLIEDTDRSDDYDSSRQDEAFSSQEERLNDYLEDYLGDDVASYKLEANNYSADDEEKNVPMVVETSFFEYLDEQLGLLTLNPQEAKIAEQIIGSLDDGGYLQRQPEDLVDDLLFSQNLYTDVAEVKKVIAKIQQLEPAGICATSLQECLYIQLYRKLHADDVAQNYSREGIKTLKLAASIIKDYFEEFSKKHYQRLLQQLNIDRDQLKDATDEILKLHPKPGGLYAAASKSQKQYIIPDFIIENNMGRLELTLNARNAPELRVSDHYKEMLQSYSVHRKDKKQREAALFVKQKIDSAKWFIDAIRQRQKTMLDTMGAIMAYQEDFFLTGDERRLRPMILKDVAEVTGLDISTVSRVANSKYVQTEFGTKRLKSFFSESLQTDTGEEVSTLEVKKILTELISGEDKRQPHSDEALKNMLLKRGYNIARRTVAKYREQLNIPVARLRKEI
jgi:RNA polymerase sigma-54 factor